MKILMVNTNDINGGAARAAFRIHEALLQNGIDSQMLVDNKESDINTILTLPNKTSQEKFLLKLDKFIKIILNILPLIKYRKTMSKNYGPFSPQIFSNKKIIKQINKINPDIVHLHWICGGFLAIEDIAKIKAPIVWSLHDMWAFTGGCHLVTEHISPQGNCEMCDKYIENCEMCDFLGSKKVKDLSYKILQRKKKSFKKIKSMTIIGVSKWMSDCAKKSAVFANRTIVTLPNPLNAQVFKLVSKDFSRELWRLPKNKKLILFGAIASVSTPYKGYNKLIEALNKVQTDNVECVVFGASKPNELPKIPQKIHYVGHLNDNVSITTLYSACDLTVVPSLREAFGQVAAESLSCRVPVVAFGTQGLLDVIEHKITGYLAQPFDTSDLANGIDWVLNNENYDELSKNAREKVLREFDYSVVAGKYLKLYEEILEF